MKQLAKLAQAIAHGPKLLFLDEPTNGLDPAARIRMMQLIREIRDTGEVSVLISSHLLRDVEECCDEVLILKDGRIARCAIWKKSARPTSSFWNWKSRRAMGFWSPYADWAANAPALAQDASASCCRTTLICARSIALAAEHEVQIRRMNYRRDTLEDIFLKAMAGTPQAAPVQQGSANGSL